MEISDIEDFPIELVNPEFEQVYYLKNFIIFKVFFIKFKFIIRNYLKLNH